MKKLVIHGIGEHFYNVIKRLGAMDKQDKFLESVSALSDANEKKHGTTIMGKKVIDPMEIKNMDYDLVLVGTSYAYLDEVKEFLIKDCAVKPEKIANLDDYIITNIEIINSGGEFSTFDVENRTSGLGRLRMDAFTTYDILKPVYNKNGQINYEMALELTYSKFIDAGDTVIDIGAHKGRHSFALINLIGPEGRLFAFEPLQNLCRKLSQMMNRYSGPGPYVEVINCALSDEEGKLEFYEYLDRQGASGLKKRETVTFDTELRSEMRINNVDVFKLDRFIDKFGRIDYIKMDCEGAEISIIKGGAETIKKFRPIMSVEYSLGGYKYYSLTKNSLYELCMGMDYFVTDVFGNLIPTLESWEELSDSIYWDYFLVPKEKIGMFCRRIHSSLD